MHNTGKAQEENCMRRFLAVILTIVMMVVAGGCAKTTAEAKSASNAKFERLMYFEKYRNIRAEENIAKPTDRTVHAADYGTVLSIFEWNGRISELFEEAKSDIRSFFKSADFFDWERFENAQLAQMKEESLIVEGRAGEMDAAYIVNDNVVMVFQCVGRYQEEDAKAVMAHELIHSLTENQNSVKNPAIYEGLTEMLSCNLYGTLPLGYGAACAFVAAYVDVLGMKEATKNILNGEFEPFNSKTSPNAVEDVSKSIFALDGGYGTEEDYILYVDLIANYAINTKNEALMSEIKNMPWEGNPEVKEYFDWLIEEGGDNNTAA